MKKSILALLIALACTSSAFALPRSITLADGTTFPSGTVTVICPYAAGGGTDLGIRLFVKYAQNYIDVPMIVENITGGSGFVGQQTCLNRPADGHTMMHIDTGTQYVTTENSVCPFDVREDVAYVGQLVVDDRVWVMKADDKRFSTAEEFFKYAKEHPGEISCATSGNATISGCSTIYLQQAAGAELNIISFGGVADAKAAFLGGHCDILAAGVSEADPMIKENQGKIICSMTDSRLDMDGFRDAPTCKELGFDILSVATNRGIGMSKKTDPAIVKFWSDIMDAVTADPEFVKEAGTMSLMIGHRNSEEFAKLAMDQYKLWYDIKVSAGM